MKSMRAVDILRKKRDGETLVDAEIDAFVRGAATGDWPDYQLSAMLMAIFQRGMSDAETARLTRSMADSGTRYRWDDIPGPKADKHSTGGVGDKTSLILAPLAAACGVIVPMMSGRGLGHSGGTLDKLESIPGFRVGLDESEMRVALKAIGVAMIGQTAQVAPADKKLYALRDVTATVECIPLITGSILSKKLSEGIDALVMDVKFGRGAFMKTKERASQLAETIARVGTANGVATEAVLNPMDEPLGRCVGNALEVVESIETLKGRGPKDLTDLSVDLAARMVRMSQLAKTQSEAEAMVRRALADGRGLEKFRQIIAQQGGDPKVVDDYSLLPKAPYTKAILAEKDGVLRAIDAEKIGIGSTMLGAGRSKAEDRVDPAVGIVLRATSGQPLKRSTPILEVHYRDEASLQRALPTITEAIEYEG
jgi:pyrimidine-nucleoside phosphorylase